ncbi:hypothetical protein RR46_07102 [Papilio xuthus]|uniref:Uncharacterized protein n=1 Tax=Papilio xuthus TaxID=66420 RepID=A0A194Q4P2_PAPXU|nr:hypothetical protein RR46_07102 [Papilio xuthus]
MTRPRARLRFRPRPRLCQLPKQLSLSGRAYLQPQALDPPVSSALGLLRRGEGGDILPLSPPHSSAAVRVLQGVAFALHFLSLPLRNPHFAEVSDGFPGSLRAVSDRSGCPASCSDDDIKPVCAVSSIDNHVVLFKNICALDTANCRQGVLQALINNVLSPTPSVKERIAILKSKLLNDGHASHPSIFNYYDEASDDYENHDFLIEPITRNRANKKYKFKTKTTQITNVTKQSNPQAKRQGLKPFLKSQANTKKKEKLFLNPMDIFYRRLIGEQYKDENWRWTLCQDIITPFLTGVKKGPMEMTKIGIKHAIPERVFHNAAVRGKKLRENLVVVEYQPSRWLTKKNMGRERGLKLIHRRALSSDETWHCFHLTAVYREPVTMHPTNIVEGSK